MNAILAFIPKTVMAGLIIALAVSTGLQSCRVASLSTELGIADAAIAQCAETNTTNVANILELETNNAACIAGREADEKTMNEAVVAWGIEKELLNERADNVQTQTVEVFRDPTCAEFAKVDVAAVCPAMADGLRQRAKNYNQD